MVGLDGSHRPPLFRALPREFEQADHPGGLIGRDLQLRVPVNGIADVGIKRAVIAGFGRDLSGFAGERARSPTPPAFFTPSATPRRPPTLRTTSPPIPSCH